MTKKEELDLFKNWDKIYANVRKEKLLKDVVKISLSDTRELHKNNVIYQIEKEHNTAKIISTIKSN